MCGTIGELLEEGNFVAWLAISAGLAAAGTIFMAIFYYLDWRRAPKASSLTAAPELDVHDKKSIARSLRWAAGQSQTREDLEGHHKAKLVSSMGGGIH